MSANERESEAERAVFSLPVNRLWSSLSWSSSIRVH